jgi:hypothetical protein
MIHKTYTYERILSITQSFQMHSIVVESLLSFNLTFAYHLHVHAHLSPFRSSCLSDHASFRLKIVYRLSTQMDDNPESAHIVQKINPDGSAGLLPFIVISSGLHADSA